MSLAQIIGAALTIYGVAMGNAYIALAGRALMVADARETNRRAKASARAQYEATLQDRLEMVERDPQQARTLALGRVRAVEGVRRYWASGDNSEKFTEVVSFAGHEIDGFEGFYFFDTEVSLDGSGYVLTAPYAKADSASSVHFGTLNGSGGAVVVLASTPVSGSVTVLEAETTQLMSVSVVGSTVTISGGTPSADFSIYWQGGSTSSTARIRTYTGTALQNVGADLDSEYPGKITSTDRFAGIALAVVDLNFDQDVYPQGRPKVTALFRGAKCYDPRLDSTNGGSGSHRIDDESTWEWTENPALHAVRYAMWAYGWRLRFADINWPDVIVASDVCEEETDFTVRYADDSTDTVTLPRYRCGITIRAGDDPNQGMASIMATMAGAEGWAGGVWRMRAGHMKTPAFDMDQTWLANKAADSGMASLEPTLQIANGIPRESKINRVSGKCIDPDQRWQILPFPAVEDPVLISAEGETYETEVEMAGVNHIAHAQHLGGVMVRRAQAPLTIVAKCLPAQAFRVELFDVCTLSLPRYGIADKTMEVLGWKWHPAMGVELTLREITQAIFDPAELKGIDPAPNVTLPQPWDVEQLTGLEASSSLSTDGSILTRVTLTWDASTQQSVRAGGTVEIQYWRADTALPDGDWLIWPEAGDSTSSVIPALESGQFYLFRARFKSAAPFRVRGPWSVQVLHAVATAPDTGLAEALAAAAAAQATADGKIDTFWQSSPPGTAAEGDIWFDTDDGYRQYRYTASVWEVAADTRIGQAISDASDAQATADGKVTTFLDSSPPTAEAVGDLWLDTDDGNKLYRWDGGAWIALPVGTGGIEPGAAFEANSEAQNFSGAAYGNGAIVHSFTFTPASDARAEFTATVTADNLLGDAGSSIRWYVTPSGGSPTLLKQSGLDTTARSEVTAVAMFDALAGVDLLFELSTHTGGGGNPPIHVWAVDARIGFAYR